METSVLPMIRGLDPRSKELAPLENTRIEKQFRVDRINSLAVLEQRFDGPRPEYRQGDPVMKGVIVNFRCDTVAFTGFIRRGLSA